MKSQKQPFVIAVSGDPVSGKSSTIRELMARYESMGYNSDGKKVIVKFGAGTLCRNISIQAGITVSTFGELAKDSANTMRSIKEMATNKQIFDAFEEEELGMSIDNCIDHFILKNVRQSKEELKSCDESIIIADSRIAGLLMRRDGEEVFNVRFSIKPEIAAKRLILDAANRKSEITFSGNERLMLEEAIKSVKRRALEDRIRFIQNYSTDLNDPEENSKVDLLKLENYDLVIDTSKLTISRVTDILLESVENVRSCINF